MARSKKIIHSIAGTALADVDFGGLDFLFNKFGNTSAAFSLSKLSEEFGTGGAAGIDLSLTNSGVTQDSGIVGSSGNFDGSSDLQGGTEEAFQPDTEFTYETWVYPADQSTERTIASNYNGLDNVGWEVSVGSGSAMRFYLNDGSSFIVPNGGSVPINEWSHLVARWDGSTAELFINGSSVASEGISNVAPSSRNFLIGNSQGPGDFWNGRIGPTRLWNGRTLSNIEISTLYNSDNGLTLSDIESNHTGLLDDLVLAYEFEDSNDLGKDSFVLDGPVLNVRRATDDVKREIGFESDKLKNFANGGDVFVKRWNDQSSTDTNVSQSTKSKQPRIVNGGSVESIGGKTAMHFSESNTQYLIANSHPFTETTFTVMAWVYRESTSIFHAAISKGSGPNDTKNFWLGGDNGKNKVLFSMKNTSGTNFKAESSTDSLPLSTWTFICGRYDGSSQDIFINGVLDTSIDNSITPVTDSTTGLTVGAGAEGDQNHFDGYIKTPIVYPEVLSDNDIKQIYNETK